ncbi:MAG TPA: DUF2703 domain-containing protein [Candidatus Hydrogenedentes bacterium]|nr:DUF2703 domain-containing protein [Candidatus Hydrogenedentota bacterium]HOL76747.1 DUF2703 domain-containing protein [Candidatus Hydrogenedentota bacterium]HPO85292.1 DUF2703 domain-containing protein [Candidatus Hydrogenedentota bacterium]
MVVRFLYFEGCPNSQPALALLKEVLLEEGVQVPIDLVEVTNAEQAMQERFLGSPSIQINGLDIEVSRRHDAPCFSCRVYKIHGKTQGIPSKEMIHEAVREARNASRKG